MSLYEPLFNTVVVQIDDKGDAWGGSKDDSAGLLGNSYNKGVLLAVASELYPFGDTSEIDDSDLADIGERLSSMIGQSVMWNKGHEGDNIFEESGVKYAFIFWWDILGIALPDGVTYAEETREARDLYIPGSVPEEFREYLATDDPPHTLNVRGECGVLKEDDISVTRQALKKAGVANWETIEITGGGHENSHITGVR